MEYNFRAVEQKWQKYWEENNTYKVDIDTEKPKYYVLDMFPYPSGAGLHVGHPLGYIASDIYSRYKTLEGYNVLHPMGFDAFGLPAEQYAIQFGKHPKVTTEQNINRYKEQLKNIGLSYDWSREVKTSDPQYYKWTQWTFLRMFNHWFNNNTQKAEPIDTLIAEFNKNGNMLVNASCSPTPKFYAEVWRGMEEKERMNILLNYRLAYRAKTLVNWCPNLGTVLANDEVKEGLSVRGGHPVIQKPMLQWLIRVTAYAERLVNSLDNLQWTDALKEMQRNWIGRSQGAEVLFPVKDSNLKIKVFTTRPDTIYGATFMVIAPENPLLLKITTEQYASEIKEYIENTKKKTERERQADVKTITGQFSGDYAINPFTNSEIPIWTSDYVLAGYGTGAIMAVPAHDSRDFAFAKYFNIPIIQVVSGAEITENSYDAKEGTMINSGIIDGLEVKDAMTKIIDEIEKRQIGKRQINYRIRDAIFSRQRYWGEPFPFYYKDDIAYPIDENNLPLQLPNLDVILPTEKGEPPLARLDNWKTSEGYQYETSTMPGFAGSSAYFIRFMDPNNDQQLVSTEANNYWQDVDLYIGGTEHAVGHLIYSRFWNKFLYDLGYVCKDEPFKKLINQGMIQGRSNFVYRIKNTNTFVSYNLKDNYEVTELYADVNIVNNDVLDIEKFKMWNPEYQKAEFILEDDKYICGWAVEKMSKSMYNVVNPDNIIEQYGADTLRLYEMFLGPLEQSKPWNTNSIEGVYKFINKFWRLFFDKDGKFIVTAETPSREEFKILHKTIKKTKEDIEKLSLNTSVSAFMICVNELTSLKCNKKEILEPLTIILSAFAPHITEEIWQLLGHTTSIRFATFPKVEEQYLLETQITYPIALNGKTKFTLDIPIDFDKNAIEKEILNNDKVKQLIDNKTVIKFVIVPNRMINIVVK